MHHIFTLKEYVGKAFEEVRQSIVVEFSEADKLCDTTLPCFCSQFTCSGATCKPGVYYKITDSVKNGSLKYEIMKNVN